MREYKKKKVVNLTHYYNEKIKLKVGKYTHYLKKLYSTNSFILNVHFFRQFYYALNLSSLNQEKIVLDIGCGPGPFFPSLNTYGKRIIGVDLRYYVLLNFAKDLVSYEKNPLKKVSLLNSDAVSYTHLTLPTTPYV